MKLALARLCRAAALVLAALAAAPQPAQAGAGQLLRAEPLYGAPEGATAYRIDYQSTGLHGESIVVSGMVIVPAGRAPAGARPVVAWAHPTTGVVERCAPSLARKRFQMIAGLRLMLARGFVVAATDYPGLGTPETHPYLVGESEGRAVLDSVRAARQIPSADAGAAFVVWGHSQGGQAALFTGLLAERYAPELKLLGVAAAAPATELAQLMKADLDSNGGRNLTAMTLWSWQRIYHAPSDAVLDPSAIPVVNQLAGECIESLFDVFERKLTQRPLAHAFLVSDDFISREPWASLLKQNTPGALPAKLPVFLAQGTTDQLVLPAVTRDYARRLCANGSAVLFDPVANTGHGFVAFKASDAAVAWIADRFAGARAPSNCGAI
jgi:alpha-beta hydrolase superfamily lysophospholipase